MADDLRALAVDAAKRHNIPPTWFVSLIDDGEGGFRNPKGVSPKGARGVGQLMPATAEGVGVGNRDDPSANIEGAARYAAQMWRRYKGDAKVATAAYNAGPANADKHGRNLDAYPVAHETKPYVNRVKLPTFDEALTASPHDLPTFDDMLRQHSPTSSEQHAANDPTHAVMRPGRSRMGEAVSQAGHAAARAFDLPGQVQTFQNNLKNPLTNAAAPFMAAATAGGNVLNALQEGASTLIQPFFEPPHPDAAAEQAAAQTNWAHPFFLDPHHVQTPHGQAEAAVNVATMAAPTGLELAGGRAARATLEASEAARAALARRVGGNTTRQATDIAHAARVQRLANDGMEFTPGQIKGGEARRVEQKNKSGRYQGEAIRAGEQRALDSMNVAVAKKALAPIGETYPGNEVGREGVDFVARRIGRTYEDVLPKALLKPDEQLAEQISEIEENHAELLGPYQSAFKSILNNRVLKRLGPDKTMDGETFKQVESELNALSRTYRKEGGGAELLADSIDQMNTALLDNLERHSPEEVRPQLKAANTAWAIYKRMESAAGRRPGSLGKFSTGDLLQAVKSGAPTKGSFARGNALLSKFADDAHAVIGDVEPDSGTAGRLNQTRSGMGGAIVGGMAGNVVGHGPVGGAIGAGLGSMADRQIGGATNAIAGALMRRESTNALARLRNEKVVPNYSQAAARRATRSNFLPVVSGAVAGAEVVQDQ